MDAVSTLTVPMKAVHRHPTNFVAQYVRDQICEKHEDKPLCRWFKKLFDDDGFQMRSRKLSPSDILSMCARKHILVTDSVIKNVLSSSNFVTENGPWRSFGIVPADFFLHDGVYLCGLKSALEALLPATTPHPEDAFSLAFKLADGEIETGIGYEQILVAHEPFASHSERVGHRLVVYVRDERVHIDTCQLVPNATLTSDWGLLLQEAPQKICCK